MKKLLLVLVLFISFGAIAQTDSTLVDSSGITPKEIADIIEFKVQPIIDVAVEEIRKAPVKGGVTAWIGWAVTALFAFIGVITAIFFSGSKRNLKLD